MRILLACLLFAPIIACNMPEAGSTKSDSAKNSLIQNEKSSKDPVKSSWDYSIEEDKMTSGKTLVAGCTSIESLNLNFPYAGINYATITIQSRRGRENVLLSVTKGQILERRINIRFDEGKMESFDASGPSDGDSRYAFLDNARKIIAKLKTAKHIIVEAELYDNGVQQMEFNTTGLIWPPKDPSSVEKK